MSTDRLWRTLAVLLPAFAAILAPLSTVDLAYHLRAGAEILATGAIPTADTWTFTVAGTTWYDQQWAAQLVLHLTHQTGSWTGLVLLRAIATGIVFACLLVIATRHGMRGRTAALLVLAAFVVAAPAMALRPQLFGMVCFALVLLLIDGRRTHPRLVWLVPLIVVAWANLHGSFFLGPLALGLAWLADRHDGAATARTTLALTVASVLTSFATPAGPLVWLYAVGLSIDPSVTARISEWQPTSLRTPAGIAFFASAAGVAAAVARRSVVISWPTLLWLGAFGAIGLYAERGVAWWALAAVWPVAHLLSNAQPSMVREDRTGMRRANVALLVVLLVSGVLLLPWWRPIDPATNAPLTVLTDAPAAVTGVLRATATSDDRILNHQAWGSWLEYAIPQATVAIDSRIELYPPEVWAAYERVMAGVDGWQDQVDAWGVTLVVLDAEATGTRDRFVAAGWRALLDDADGVVLERP